MSRPTIPDKVLQRIKKMNLMAESAKSVGNAEEAQAFASGVQRMLAEYELEIEQVMQAADDNTIDGEVVMDVAERDERTRWEMILAHAIAESYGCYPLFTEHTNTMYVVGKRVNRQAACYVIAQLHAYAERESELATAAYEAHSEEQRRQDAELQRMSMPGASVEADGNIVTMRSYDGFTISLDFNALFGGSARSYRTGSKTTPEQYRTNWLDGFAFGIMGRMERNEREAAAAGLGGGEALQQRGMQLVRVATKEAEDAVRKAFPEMQADQIPKKRDKHDPQAYAAGMEAAEAVSLGGDRLGEAAGSRTLPRGTS